MQPTAKLASLGCLHAFLLIFLFATCAYGQHDYGNNGVALHVGGDARISAECVPLADGALAVAWTRIDSSFYRHAYLQVINTDQSLRFSDGPLELVEYGIMVRDVHIVPMDDGGWTVVYVKWLPGSGGESYVQRYDSDGIPQFADPLRFGFGASDPDMDETMQSFAFANDMDGVFFLLTRRVNDSRNDVRLYGSTGEGEIYPGYSFIGRILFNYANPSLGGVRSSNGTWFSFVPDDNAHVPCLNNLDNTGTLLENTYISLYSLEDCDNIVMAEINDEGELYVGGFNDQSNQFRVLRTTSEGNARWNNSLPLTSFNQYPFQSPCMRSMTDDELVIVAESDSRLRAWRITGETQGASIWPSSGVGVHTNNMARQRFSLLALPGDEALIAWGGVPETSEDESGGMVVLNRPGIRTDVPFFASDMATIHDVRLLNDVGDAFYIIVAGSQELRMGHYESYESEPDWIITLDEYPAETIAAAACEAENGLIVTQLQVDGYRPFRAFANTIDPDPGLIQPPVSPRFKSEPVIGASAFPVGSDFVVAVEYADGTIYQGFTSELEVAWDNHVEYAYTHLGGWGNDDGFVTFNTTSDNAFIQSFDVNGVRTEVESFPDTYAGFNDLLIIGSDDQGGWIIDPNSTYCTVHRVIIGDESLPWNDGLPVYAGANLEGLNGGNALMGYDVALGMTNTTSSSRVISVMRYDMDMNPIFTGGVPVPIIEFPEEIDGDIHTVFADGDNISTWILFSTDGEGLFLQRISCNGVLEFENPIIVQEGFAFSNLRLKPDEQGGVWIGFSDGGDQDQFKVYHVDADGDPASDWWMDGPVKLVPWASATTPLGSYVDELGGWNIAALNEKGSSYDGSIPPVVIQRILDDLDDVTERSNPSVPDVFEVTGCWPNPFNSTVRVNFRVQSTSLLTVKVYDVLGREVKQLERSLFNAGQHAIHWDGMDQSGTTVASGIYFIRFHGPGINHMERVTILR